MTGTEIIRSKCKKEIEWLKDLTAYEADLVPFESYEEAETTVFQWIHDGIAVPDKLIWPGVLMVLWNLFIAPDEWRNN